jgi:hypothetical protein
LYQTTRRYNQQDSHLRSAYCIFVSQRKDYIILIEHNTIYAFNKIYVTQRQSQTIWSSVLWNNHTVVKHGPIQSCSFPTQCVCVCIGPDSIRLHSYRTCLKPFLHRVCLHRVASSSSSRHLNQYCKEELETWNFKWAARKLRTIPPCHRCHSPVNSGQWYLTNILASIFHLKLTFGHFGNWKVGGSVSELVSESEWLTEWGSVCVWLSQSWRRAEVSRACYVTRMLHSVSCVPVTCFLYRTPRYIRYAFHLLLHVCQTCYSTVSTLMAMEVCTVLYSLPVLHHFSKQQHHLCVWYKPKYHTALNSYKTSIKQCLYSKNFTA